MSLYKSDNTTRVLSRFLADLFIPVTRESIYEELHKHPDFPSMLSISDVLNRWNIPNASYELSFEELVDIPTPFIAHFEGGFVVVSQLEEQRAIVSNENWKNHKLDIEKFKQSYKGIVLIAEKDEISGEVNYTKKRRREIISMLRIPFVILVAIILFFAFLLLNPSYKVAISFSIALLTIFKTLGLVTSILLLIQSIDSNNPLIQKLCGGSNKKDCNAILSSKAAKISEEISWAEIGFVYFAGTWLILLFNSENVSLIQMLAFFNLVSLPYTFYSIYYQWRVVKKWCIFCCAIQGLFWFEFFTFLPYLKNTIQLPDLVGWCNLLFGIFIPMLLWIFMKPYLLQAQQLQPLKQQLYKFKYRSSELFNKLLNEQAQFALLAEEDSITLGNKDVKHIITMVSNPYCPPCSKAHQSLDEWLTYRNDIQLQVVFAPDNDERSSRTKVANHLMTLKSEQDEITLKNALDDWYGQKNKNYETWANTYPVKEQHASSKTLEKQSDWCNITEITHTPTIFINGRRLPKSYNIEDIKYFI